MSKQPSPSGRMRGQTVLVTGTTKGGIGYETARLLGDEGATVLTHGRTPEAAGARRKPRGRRQRGRQVHPGRRRSELDRRRPASWQTPPEPQPPRASTVWSTTPAPGSTSGGCPQMASR